MLLTDEQVQGLSNAFTQSVVSAKRDYGNMALSCHAIAEILKESGGFNDKFDELVIDRMEMLFLEGTSIDPRQPIGFLKANDYDNVIE